MQTYMATIPLSSYRPQNIRLQNSHHFPT